MVDQRISDISAPVGSNFLTQSDDLVVVRSGVNNKVKLPVAIFNASDITGATNMATELETFVAANQGYLIRVPDHAILLINNFGLGLAATNDVRIDFGQATILYDSGVGNRCIDLSNTANASAEVAVTAVSNVTINSKTRSTQITLAATVGGQAHDWVAVYTTDANPAISGGQIGEIHQLIQDEATLILNTTGTFARDPGTFLTLVKCRKLDNTRKVFLNGGIFKANGDPDDLLITAREECIRLTAFVDPVITNPTFDGPWAQGVWLQCTGGAVVDGLTIKNTLQAGGSNGFSYGTVLYAMNGNPVIKNTVARNCRHPAGTTDGNSSTSTTWFNKGYPTYYKFINTVGYNCYGSVGDSHEEGLYGLWDGLWSHNNVQDASVIFIGSLFQGRAGMETIRNFGCIGGSRGMSFLAIDHGFEDQVVIENGTFRKLHNGGTSSYGIEFKANTKPNKRRFRINNVNMHDVDIGFGIFLNNLVHITDCYVASASAYGDAGAGTEVIVKGMVFDNINTTAPFSTSAWQCRSSVADGGCSVICLDSPVVLKGTLASQPTSFFNEMDILANKTVYHPGIIEYNPNVVTATASKEVGSTTFQNATTVSTIIL